MAGNYTCKPYNSWGSAGSSDVIRVVVEEEVEEGDDAEDPLVPGLPRLGGAWVEQLEVEVGQEVRLECRADGEPAPEVLFSEKRCWFYFRLILCSEGGLGPSRVGAW